MSQGIKQFKARALSGLPAMASMRSLTAFKVEAKVRLMKSVYGCVNCLDIIKHRDKAVRGCEDSLASGEYGFDDRVWVHCENGDAFVCLWNVRVRR